MKNIIKKLCVVALAGAVAVCTVSCGNKGNSTGSTGSTTSGKEDIGANTSYGDAIGLLNAVWAAYGEAEKFPASGGDESNLNFEGPGEYSVENSEMLDGVLGFPAELADKIDSAASLSHAMNANTFTCGAFHFKNKSDAEAAVVAIKNNILARHWICGFPDSILIITAPGNYVIAVWGIDENTDVVATFKNKVLSTVDGAAVAVEEPIV